LQRRSSCVLIVGAKFNPLIRGAPTAKKDYEKIRRNLIGNI
jgi:hypothetical protein